MSSHPYLKGLSAAERVAFALAYPFAMPTASYVLTREGVRAWDRRARDLALGEERVAVIACGSNASPDQLVRKFGRVEADIPTAMGLLEGYAIAFSAKFTAYGSMPATLVRAPGARTRVFVNFLTRLQLERMHETESLGLEYVFAELTGLDLRLETGEHLSRAAAYVSLLGALAPARKVLHLAEVRQVGNLARATQREAQKRARDLIAPGARLEAFVDATIMDGRLRAGRIEALKAHALEIALKAPNS